MTFSSQVRGVGSYLPKRVLMNDALPSHLDTSDHCIMQRTGIRQRHLAAEDETTSILGTKAAERALAAAELTVDDIDLFIAATATPDYTLPGIAPMIQANLGGTKGAAFDVSAVCSGFLFALSIADKFLCSGSHHRALVIGAETFSRVVDWEDRTSCVLFGDGAGALVLERAQGEGGRGILTTHLQSDGRHFYKLFVDGGPSSAKKSGFLRMQGRDVFRHAVEVVREAVDVVCQQANVSLEDVDWFVPHQANRRIIVSSAEILKMPLEKIIITIDHHANTSAASIPLALAEGVVDGRIKKGDLILLESMGAGFSWGSVLLRW